MRGSEGGKREETERGPVKRLRNRQDTKAPRHLCTYKQGTVLNQGPKRNAHTFRKKLYSDIPKHMYIYFYIHGA